MTRRVIKIETMFDVRVGERFGNVRGILLRGDFFIFKFLLALVNAIISAALLVIGS